MTCRLMIALAILPTIGTGSRLKQIGQHELLTKDPIPWKRGTSYICLAKWEKRSNEYQDKWCLAPLEEVMKGMETGARKMKVTKHLRRCVAQSASHRFKVCNLKGKEDKRLNYGEKKYLPKSCFAQMKQEFVAPGKDGPLSIPLVVAAVKAEKCRNMFDLTPTLQAKLGTEEDSSGKSKKPVQKPVEPVTDADWNNIPAPVYVEDATTTTTTTMDEDSVDEDETTTTTTTTIIIEDEALENLLKEDREDIEENGLDVEELDELGTDIDSGVEDRLEEQVHVQDGLQESAELDLDALGVPEIRELWQRRAEKNKPLPE